MTKEDKQVLASRYTNTQLMADDMDELEAIFKKRKRRELIQIRVEWRPDVEWSVFLDMEIKRRSVVDLNNLKRIKRRMMLVMIQMHGWNMKTWIWKTLYSKTLLKNLNQEKRFAERVDFHNHSSKALFSLVEDITVSPGHKVKRHHISQTHSSSSEPCDVILRRTNLQTQGYLSEQADMIEK